MKGGDEMLIYHPKADPFYVLIIIIKKALFDILKCKKTNKEER